MGLLEGVPPRPPFRSIIPARAWSPPAGPVAELFAIYVLVQEAQDHLQASRDLLATRIAVISRTTPAPISSASTCRAGLAQVDRS